MHSKAGPGTLDLRGVVLRGGYYSRLRVHEIRQTPEPFEVHGRNASGRVVHVSTLVVQPRKEAVSLCAGEAKPFGHGSELVDLHLPRLRKLHTAGEPCKERVLVNVVAPAEHQDPHPQLHQRRQGFWVQFEEGHDATPAHVEFRPELGCMLSAFQSLAHVAEAVEGHQPGAAEHAPPAADAGTEMSGEVPPELPYHMCIWRRLEHGAREVADGVHIHRRPLEDAAELLVKPCQVLIDPLPGAVQ
mmetsp:Transcript_66065/g.208776  ORF Transcript_66065/g.208776 Transcript_66065/m.208776 type:complete len:244 (-) Transcript_66065:64-795(-)